MPTITLISVVRLSAFMAVLAVGAPMACGGKVVSTGGGSEGASGSGGSGGSATNGTSGSGGSGGAVGGSGGSGGAVGGSGGSGGVTIGGSGGSGGSDGSTGTCVDIRLSDFDTSCNKSSDCVEITAGTICNGGCECGGATINASGMAQYNADIASIVPGLCGCPISGTPTCVMGTCKNCLGSSCGPKPPIDAGSPPPGSFSCEYAVGGYSYCYSYNGLSASEVSAEMTACKAETGAKVVASCPGGFSGCCEDIPLSGTTVSYGYCTYGVPASSLSSEMTACAAVKGTWK